MSDNRSHKSHKRQKSSALNINYYFPPPPQPGINPPTALKHDSDSHLNIPHSSPTHHHYPSSPDHFQQQPIVPASHQQTPIQDFNSHAYTYPQSEPPYTTAPPLIPIPLTANLTQSVALDQQSQSLQSSPTFNQYPQQFIYPSVDYQQTTLPGVVSGVVPSAASGSMSSGPSDFAFPKPMAQPDLYYQSPSKVLPARQRIQHNKNNLSISSHFNLFNLKEEFEPTVRSLEQVSQRHSTTSLPNPLHSHSHSHSHSAGSMELLPAANIYTSTTSASESVSASASSTIANKNNLIQALLVQLPSIDGQNINYFLLDVLHKISNQLPLDEFYNILYNSDDGSDGKKESSRSYEKIDQTQFPSPSIPEASSYTVALVLSVFKNPISLNNFIPNIDTSLIKLTSVNYHELLRTFLAIKILSDLLVQLPGSTVELEHTIPRLSIYKTYYIICQKLITNYPSSSNSVSEQQKIILGQSKLGKLIKLVYPNLKIKRLGSRGESKYNYLGVVWNDKIIHQDIKDLCENNELSDLNTYFILRKNRMKSSKRKASGQLQSTLPLHDISVHQQHPHVQDQQSQDQLFQQLQHDMIVGGSSELHLGSGTDLPHGLLEHGLGLSLGTQIRDSSTNKRIPSSGLGGNHSGIPGNSSINTDNYSFAPQLSFTNPFLKFPTFDDFSLAPDLNQESWFDSISKEQSIIVDGIINNNENILDLVENIFIFDLVEQDENNNTLLTNFMDKIINPYFATVLSKPDNYHNLDLRVYLIVIIKLLPYLLLLTVTPVKGFENHSSFLQTLRSNLIQFVNNYTDSLVGLESIFPHTNATIFCIILKKLINVNDLLITFIKLIMKEEGFSSTRNSMKSDIQNYLISPSPSLSFENNEIRFNFKEDIVQNDLIFSLMGYNYNPVVSELLLQQHQQFQQQIPDFGISSQSQGVGSVSASQGASQDKPSSVVSMKFVREEASLIEQFFKVDLVGFLSAKNSIQYSQLLPDDPAWTNLLSNQEFDTLVSLIKLMHESLLSTHFKSRYPILVYHNFISQILNDLLKHIYSKQQVQLQHQMQSSFGNWWVFNSFVEEYIGLMGEIVGLFQTI